MNKIKNSSKYLDAFNSILREENEMKLRVDYIVNTIIKTSNLKNGSFFTLNDWRFANPNKNDEKCSLIGEAMDDEYVHININHDCYTRSDFGKCIINEEEVILLDRFPISWLSSDFEDELELSIDKFLSSKTKGFEDKVELWINSFFKLKNINFKSRQDVLSQFDIIEKKIKNKKEMLLKYFTK